MKRISRWKKSKTLRIATWNITSLNTKDQEVIEELSDRNIDICGLQETKKKGKGQQQYSNYILIYSGVPKDQRAAAGVGILISRKYKNNLESCHYISERIIHVKIALDQQKLNVLSIYSPEDGKPKQQTETFYEELQNTLDSIPNTEPIILLGDFNARIGSDVIHGVKQRFNEEQLNGNGELMINFCAYNELRINNTFFPHKDQYKYTFQNTRGQKSMIDFIVTNRKIHPAQVLDIRTLNSANAGNDHSLLLGKFRLQIKPKKQPERTKIQRINIDSLWHESTKQLYQDRLAQKIEDNPVYAEEDINISWKKIEENMETAAKEALGTRIITLNNDKHPNKTPWFHQEVKNICKEKRKAYLAYRSLKTPESHERYKRKRNETKALVRHLKNEYWEQFSAKLEKDFYGTQKQTWRVIRQQRKEIAELYESTLIPEHKWEQYLTELFKGTPNGIGTNAPRIQHDVEVSIDEVAEAIKSLKNRKSPGQNGIYNELLKCGGQHLTEELTKLIKNILNTCRIPDPWRTSTMILMFKKGDKQEMSNYRGINLLDTTLKLTTKVITNKINGLTSLQDEQQGFRRGRSCVDAVFVLRQITEKSIEYNKPAYLCFIDLTKAFDQVQLEDVIHLLYYRNIPINIVQTIENIYLNNNIQARINNKLTKPIQVNNGIRQGDSLSPLLFNIIMDEIIKKVRVGRGYRMGNEEVTIICYADDAMICAENEDDLQRLLNIFNRTGKQFNMTISAQKTKCMTTSKEPLRCKLEVDGQVIQQEMKFKYLGIDITSYGNVEDEVRQQVAKANKIAGCLNDVIWRNKHLKKHTKARVYKTTIRPIMTYTAETRADTARTRRLLETTEMKILRRISGKTLLDRERNENIRQSSGVDNVNDWVLQRKRQWNDHINRMQDSRLVKIVRDKSPDGRRSVGRPRKRWNDDLNPG